MRKRSVPVDAGIHIDAVQDDESISAPTGSLRGLHCQVSPHAPGTLVRVIQRSILDVAVDIRRDPPASCEYVAVTLTPDHANQLPTPAGFAHGFCTLQPDGSQIVLVAADFTDVSSTLEPDSTQITCPDRRLHPRPLHPRTR